MQHAKTMNKYIICGVFPTIFLWIYINTQLFPTDSWYTSFYSDCSMKMKKKSWFYVDANSEVSLCV